METPVTLAEALDSLAKTGIPDTCSLKQVLELISNTIRDYYDRSATDAISSLEEMAQSLSKKCGEERATSMLIQSLKTVPSQLKQQTTMRN